MPNDTLFWAKDGFGHVYGPFADLDECIDYAVEMELADKLASAWWTDDNPDEDYSHGQPEDYFKEDPDKGMSAEDFFKLTGFQIHKDL